jgi:hypothetical protein
MKRKNEENLIKLAFGDIDPNEAERAKRLMMEDAEAAKLFAGYSEIREGLKQLHTPEHQLSTERLREAILRDGLKKEKSAASGWRWSLAPIAVAAAAMLITLRMNSGPTPNPTIPGGTPLAFDYGTPNSDSSGTSESMIDFDPTEIARETYRGSVSRASAGPAETQPVKSSDVVELKRSVPVSKGAGVVAAEFKPAISPEDVSHMAIEGALPAGAIALHMDAETEQPIVLIGSESDESTGANRATEVRSANNVIVGG